MTFYRVAVFIPVVTSTVATATMFNWLLDPDFGLVNAALHQVGIGNQGFFRDPHEALMSIVGMTVWGWLGFGVIIYLAGPAKRSRRPPRGRGRSTGAHAGARSGGSRCHCSRPQPCSS